MEEWKEKVMENYIGFVYYPLGTNYRVEVMFKYGSTTFDYLKDFLKSRGYKYNGDLRMWFKDVKNEREVLKENEMIYKKVVPKIADDIYNKFVRRNYRYSDKEKEKIKKAIKENLITKYYLREETPKLFKGLKIDVNESYSIASPEFIKAIETKRIKNVFESFLADRKGLRLDTRKQAKKVIKPSRLFSSSLVLNEYIKHGNRFDVKGYDDIGIFNKIKNIKLTEKINDRDKVISTDNAFTLLYYYLFNGYMVADERVLKILKIDREIISRKEVIIYVYVAKPLIKSMKSKIVDYLKKTGFKKEKSNMLDIYYDMYVLEYNKDIIKSYDLYKKIAKDLKDIVVKIGYKKIKEISKKHKLNKEETDELKIILRSLSIKDKANIMGYYDWN